MNPDSNQYQATYVAQVSVYKPALIRAGCLKCSRAQANSGVNAVASVCTLLVGGGLLAFILLRNFAPGAKSLSAAEANVIFCFRVGVLQILIGIVGLVASFAFVSSVLMLACGSVVVATMKDLKSATEIGQGRLSACSAPFHGANLAISAIVFGVIDLLSGIAMRATVIPVFLYASSVSCTYSYGQASCAYLTQVLGSAVSLRAH